MWRQHLKEGEGQEERGRGGLEGSEEVRRGGGGECGGERDERRGGEGEGSGREGKGEEGVKRRVGSTVCKTRQWVHVRIQIMYVCTA